MRGRADELNAHRALLALLAVLLSTAALAPANALGGSYTVVACGSSDPNLAWAPTTSPGHEVVSSCPLGTGISTRIAVDAGRGVFERATFQAPPSTTITNFQWEGHLARNNCSWAAQFRAAPAGRSILGYTPYESCAGRQEADLALINVDLPPGTTRLTQNVQCGADRCPRGAAMDTKLALVTIEDPTAPQTSVGGGLAGGRWVSGDQQLSYIATDNTGIRRLELKVDGERADDLNLPCSRNTPAPCADHTGALTAFTDSYPDGAHEGQLVVADGVGNLGIFKTTFLSDNTPPDVVEPVVVGGDGWRSDNGFTVRWETPEQKFAPIVAARYRLCAPDGVTCEEGRRTGKGIEEIAGIAVKRLGDSTLQVWLEDEAGNQTDLGAREVHLRLDSQAPQVAFLPQDPNDPLTVAVRAVDPVSGVASGEIEMRRKGGDTWHSLATRVEGDRLVADIDDERFRRGLYEFRARAKDFASNEASTGQFADGSQAALRLPVRVSTRLVAGFPKVKVKRRVVRPKGSRGRRKGKHGRKGKRRVVKRRVRVFRSKGRVRHRRKRAIGGRLRNPDGQPIDSAPITVFSRRDLPGGKFKAVAFLRTDKKGRFRYIVRGTTSRVIRFRYDGSRRIRGATRDVSVRVPATSTLSTSRRRLRNGQSVTFRGKVRTRPIPKAGKLIEVQAFFRGRWRTISTTRTDRKGRWRFKYRFGATYGVVRYRFRALLSREGGYPFATGTSRTAVVVVRGL